MTDDRRPPGVDRLAGGPPGRPDVRVLDIRGSVATRPAEPGVEEATYRGAPDEYAAGHIPGALFVDWTSDIVDPDDPVPAQLAGPERFARAMGERGVGDSTRVIAVDHMGGQFATRLWWALRRTTGTSGSASSTAAGTAGSRRAGRSSPSP